MEYCSADLMSPNFRKVLVVIAEDTLNYMNTFADNSLLSIAGNWRMSAYRQKRTESRATLFRASRRMRSLTVSLATQLYVDHR